ncbi:MAG: lamin tail domain-containing protein [Calditrichia bacterium]|nr:lamin tail domain-containing protein [Calditrichia bacterium]
MQIRILLPVLILFVVELAAQQVYLNEIRSNDLSTDDGEFIELIGPSGTDLTGWQIEHYNGAGGDLIFSYTLPTGTIIPDDGIFDISGQPIGFIVIKRTDHTVTNFDLEWGSNSLQNGPDGILLRDNAGVRVQALSWNGLGDLSGGDPPWRNIGSDQNTDNSLSAPDTVFESYAKEWEYVLPTPGMLNTNQSTGDISLPVELSSFRAIGGDQEVKLVWVTEAELDNLGFILERAYEQEGQFLQIASYESLDALKGAGNSSEKRRYVFIDPSVFNDITYWYRLIDVSVHGVQTIHPAVSATPTAPDVDVIEDTPEEKDVPQQFELAQNYPNPFNPNTKIRLIISSIEQSTSQINLSIYDINGQKVKTLFNGFVEPRTYEFEWDGTNDYGEPIAGGVYIYSLNTQNFSQSRKMLLLR